MKILVAEDDQRLGKLIQDYLMPESEIVDIVNTGNDIQAQLAANTYDVLILDVMLPQKNGIDICRELRAENIDIAILFITALNNQNDKIRAFESGADDYLTKPLDFQELLLRVKALVRREKKTQTITLQWGKLVMIPTQKKVYIQNQELSLTPTEFKILNIFLEHPQQVFDTDNIIDKLWDLDHIPTQNTLRSHIKSLRKKLSYAGLGKDFIETVYGLGYKLKEQKESVGESTSNQKQSEGKKSRKRLKKTINPSDKLEALIEQVWLDNQNSIGKDCQDLADYLNQKNQLIKTEQAIRIAHNLAGFLGSVGLEESGKIAKEIENLFTNNSDHLTNKKIVNNLNQLINDLEKKLFPQGKPNISTESTQNIEIKQPVNILLIDEDQNLANKLILFIEHPQINLYFSHSIESALTYLEEKEFTIIILETSWQNYAIGENQILELLIAKKGDSQIIVYTKNETLENRLYCSDYPIFAFLSKTNSLEVLWENITNLLAQSNGDASIETLYNLVLIDDDQRFTKVLQEKLTIQKLPIKLHCISDSEKFLVAIKKIKPQLIILDLQMPKLNGLDICKIIKTDPFLQEIPVIFLTGNLTSEAITQFVEVGADDFISKSKIDLELYPRIMTHLKRSQTSNYTS